MMIVDGIYGQGAPTMISYPPSAKGGYATEFNKFLNSHFSQALHLRGHTCQKSVSIFLCSQTLYLVFVRETFSHFAFCGPKALSNLNKPDFGTDFDFGESLRTTKGEM